MIGIFNQIMEWTGKPITMLIDKINTRIGDGSVSKKYVVILDKHSDLNNQIKEVLEETEKQVVVDYNGTKAWINRESIRYMGSSYKPGTHGIPEAFDASDSMYVPEIKRPILADNGPEAVAPLNGPFLEEWPTAGWKGNTIDEIDPWTLDPRTKALSKDNDELRAKNKALTARLDKKSRSNIRLNNEINNTIKLLKGMDRDMDVLVLENECLTKKTNDLIDHVNKAEETIAEMSKKAQILHAERDEYKSLNDHHREQVEIGNEQHEKTKQAVEALHEQVRDQIVKAQREALRANEAEEHLERANRVIDKLTR